MKLSVLVDNNTIIDHYFFAEPALSFLIQDQEATVLFDTGYSGIFIQNAQKMGLDLSFLDYLVISHGHFDHTWGLDALVKFFTELRIEKRPFRKPALIGHPLVFDSIESPDLDELGSLLSEHKLSKHFRMQLSKKPVQISEKLTYLGQVPRANDFESLTTHGRKEGAVEEDILLDDTALAYRASEGLVIITGCSHAGICNITEYARQVCGEERVAHIIGGFHLLDPSEKQLQGTLDYMKKLQPDTLRACHCTDLQSKIALASVSNLVEVGVGQCITYS